jgi:hypothetical protein
VRVCIFEANGLKERKVVHGCMQLADLCLATSETRPFHLTYSTYSVPLKIGQGGEAICLLLLAAVKGITAPSNPLI